METLTVNSFVLDIDKSIAFYRILGFEPVMTVPPSGKLDWAMLQNGSVQIMLQTLDSLGSELPAIDRSQPGGRLLFYIKIKGVRAFFKQVSEKVEVIKGLEKTFYGSTEFTIRDIDGFHLCFAEDE